MSFFLHKATKYSPWILRLSCSNIKWWLLKYHILNQINTNLKINIHIYARLPQHARLIEIQLLSSSPPWHASNWSDFFFPLAFPHLTHSINSSVLITSLVWLKENTHIVLGFFSHILMCHLLEKFSVSLLKWQVWINFTLFTSLVLSDTGFDKWTNCTYPASLCVRVFL